MLEKSVEITLSNGFIVSVTPLPPYYIDWIDDAFPLPKPPMRIMKLVSGDEVEYDYIVPEEIPSADNVEEYGLYLRYREFLRNTEEVQKYRDRARRDFLLSVCISIVSGPVDIASDEWKNKLEAPFKDYKVSDHPGKKLLAFMKSVVLVTAADFEIVIQSALYKEVTMQGILNSLRSFRTEMAKS